MKIKLERVGDYLWPLAVVGGEAFIFGLFFHLGAMIAFILVDSALAMAGLNEVNPLKTAIQQYQWEIFLLIAACCFFFLFRKRIRFDFRKKEVTLVDFPSNKKSFR